MIASPHVESHKLKKSSYYEFKLEVWKPPNHQYKFSLIGVDSGCTLAIDIAYSYMKKMEVDKSWETLQDVCVYGMLPSIVDALGDGSSSEYEIVSEQQEHINEFYCEVDFGTYTFNIVAASQDYPMFPKFMHFDIQIKQT